MESKCGRGMMSGAHRRWGSLIGGGWRGDDGIWLAAAGGVEAEAVGVDGESITMLASSAFRSLPWSDNDVVNSSNETEWFRFVKPWRDGGEKQRRDANNSEKYHQWWWLFTRRLPPSPSLFLFFFFVIFVWVLSMIEYGFWFLLVD